jgi:rod shape determining protein RodA
MERKFWRRFDWVLLAAVVAILGYGIAVIASATLGTVTHSGTWWDDVMVRQAIYAAVGLGLMLLVAAIPYRVWGSVGRVLYVGTLGVLALVLVTGKVFGGARSSFDLGVFPVQPSELAKVLIILALAKYMSDHDMRQLRHVLVSLLVVAVPAGLIYFQPDLGTVLVLGAVWIGMAYLAGVRLWHLGLIGLGGALALPVVLQSLAGYMRDRIVLFLDPGRDPLGAGYNLNQALIAIGSGGWMGRGWGSGTQSQLHFLRVRHTDYIFSVIGEELGFFGAIVLFVLLIVIVFRILRGADLARDDFGRLIASGVAIVISFQSFVNIGVNLGLLPTTGLTLPFVSYGGSSLVPLLISIGLVQSVVMRQKRMEFWE